MLTHVALGLKLMNEPNKEGYIAQRESGYFLYQGFLSFPFFLLLHRVFSQLNTVNYTVQYTVKQYSLSVHLLEFCNCKARP